MARGIIFIGGVRASGRKERLIAGGLARQRLVAAADARISTFSNRVIFARLLALATDDDADRRGRR